MTKQQKWAKHALERVRLYKGKGESEKKYATLCMKAPSLLRQAGLVQALAFLQTRSAKDKEKNEHNERKKLEEGNQLVADLARGLGYDGAEALQSAAHGAELADYMMLSHNAVSLATWFRRFAQAELDPGST